MEPNSVQEMEKRERQPDQVSETGRAAVGMAGEANLRDIRRPATDIVASESEVVLLMELPGVRDSGLEISLEKNILSVKAVPIARDPAGRRLLYAECGIGEYRRSFSLPEDADRDGISASLKDGVLRIRLPKIAPETRRITIANG
ncbi:MAG: Hsp20/alpha crystallin family protein [Planctomycetota bacterium]|jgi:HSP20 family protein|nr:Hsp20/alpha crystallin family protein [Planctomycetota bacterium]